MVNDVLECHRGGSGTTTIRLRAQATVPPRARQTMVNDVLECMSQGRPLTTVCLARGSVGGCHEQGSFSVERLLVL